MAKISPTARSLKWLRERGIKFAEKTEQKLPIPGKWVSRDLFNFADLVYLDEMYLPLGSGGSAIGVIIAVQVTTMSNRSARLSKIRALPAALAWLNCGGRIELHAWRKVGSPKTWQLDVMNIGVEEWNGRAN